MSDKDITAGILSVGTELTDGIIQDIHGKYVASLLKEIGIKTKKILLLPDEGELFFDELTALIADCGLVIITGGLGPTSDDLTRETVARLTGQPLEFHEEIWHSLQRRSHGRKIARTNRKQALIPKGFTVLENNHGTAPGFFGTIDNRNIIAALPGPPHELRPMMVEKLLPHIIGYFDIHEGKTIIGTSFMVPESLLEEALQDVRSGNVRWSTRVEAFRIVFTLYGDSEEELEKVFRGVEETFGPRKIRKRNLDIGPYIVDILKRNSLSLVAAESCTGGLVGKLITDVSGSSAVFWGSHVTYADDAKKKLLGVREQTLDKYGAVSAETVREMTSGAMAQADADIAVAISGIAGPEGGTKEKPVGTVWVGIRTKEHSKETKHQLYGPRDVVRRVASIAALLSVEEAVLFPERLDRE